MADVAHIFFPDYRQQPTMTVPEAAKWLGISSRSAYRAVHEGEIASVQVGERFMVLTRQLGEMLQMPQAEAS